MHRQNSRRYLNLSPSEPEKLIPSSIADASTEAQTTSEVVHGLPTYKFDFAGKNYKRQCVWGPCPAKKPKVLQLIGRTIIGPKGLAGMYIDFVEASNKDIVSALKLFADPDNFPVLVHCTQGKDRTGLITAFILSILDVPEGIIARDYALSQQGLANVYQETVDSMARKGLGPEFADAPEEVSLEVGAEGAMVTSNAHFLFNTLPHQPHNTRGLYPFNKGDTQDSPAHKFQVRFRVRLLNGHWIRWKVAGARAANPVTKKGGFDGGYGRVEEAVIALYLLRFIYL
ncbi:tyrosine phosphatase family-domain-containing protein [Endogone sp. FLAS-F59071]|nr:tyrosine phosphatase family-domain-containing protein [Endogone sp. FLAS-F59071]|eukprot:RUS19875.1 tyrosine phosphatase family-domain-containing protein [Endogone sp. FLAS-F59071]